MKGVTMYGHSLSLLWAGQLLGFAGFPQRAPVLVQEILSGGWIIHDIAEFLKIGWIEVLRTHVETNSIDDDQLAMVADAGTIAPG